MKMPPNLAQGALRISFCPDNTTDDVDAFFEALTAAMAAIAKR
jgi:cysteine sulfinate desulfinase/cysteine desulfurase-like protein